MQYFVVLAVSVIFIDANKLDSEYHERQRKLKKKSNRPLNYDMFARVLMEIFNEDKEPKAKPVKIMQIDKTKAIVKPPMIFPTQSLPKREIFPKMARIPKTNFSKSKNNPSPQEKITEGDLDFLDGKENKIRSIRDMQIHANKDYGNFRFYSKTTQPSPFFRL